MLIDQSECMIRFECCMIRVDCCSIKVDCCMIRVECCRIRADAQDTWRSSSSPKGSSVLGSYPISISGKYLLQLMVTFAFMVLVAVMVTVTGRKGT